MDEIQRLWTRRINTYDRDVAIPPECDFCKRAHATGTVVSVFGDIDSSVAVKTRLCEPCAYEEIKDGAFPSLSLVFVEPAHRVRVFASLPGDVRERLLEAEEIIERIREGLRALVAAGLAVEVDGARPEDQS